MPAPTSLLDLVVRTKDASPLCVVGDVPRCRSISRIGQAKGSARVGLVAYSLAVVELEVDLRAWGRDQALCWAVAAVPAT
jgi:hypothetical protein